MECPKCGHVQADAQQCESCGIYFAKYAEYLQEKEARIDADPAEAASAGLPWLKIGAGLTVCAVLAFVFMRGEDKQGATEMAAGANTVAKTATADSDLPATGVRAKLLASHAPGNHIEAARNATVFIETPWNALGSGFIVSSDCRVVTNKHVVQFNKDKLMQAINDPRVLGAELARQRQALLNRIEVLRAEFQEAAGRFGENSGEAISIRLKIDKLREKMRVLPELAREALQDEVSKAELYARTATYKVSLVDGTEYTINQMNMSDTHDLASFRLPASDCPFIARGKSASLKQGERLYTVGSPSGLTYTVTGGVFSGYREHEGVKYLQTDAPINPGNSGGPLITENGRFVGMNTAILQGTEGIGFAIPVESIPE